MTNTKKLINDARLSISKGNFDSVLSILKPISLETFEAAMLFGVAANRVGSLEDAADHFTKACKLAPGQIEAYYNLGLTYRAMGKNAAAEVALQKAYKIDCRSIQVNFALGNIMLHRNDFVAGGNYFAAVLAVESIHIGALNNLGICYNKTGRTLEAAHCFEEVVSQEPNNVEALANLGAIRTEQGRSDDAIDLFNQVLELMPNQAETTNNLGVALIESGRIGEAVSVLKQLTQDGGGFEAFSNLGNALLKINDVNGAAAAYERSLALKSNDGIRVKQAMLLPVVCASIEEMDEARQGLEEKIDNLIEASLQLHDPFVEVGLPTFNLSYHDYNNKDLMEKIASLYEEACPSLAFSAINSQERIGNKATGRIRIGFVSRYFQENSVGRCFQGILRYPERDDVEIIAFTFTSKHDPVWREIETDVSKAVVLPVNLSMARERISAEKLDILVFTDIGMDPLTYFLAFARLAPFQIALGGHPDTNGLRNIDAYVSCDKQEPSDADDHYTVPLIRLPGSPTYYERPKLPSLKSRDAFGLPKGMTIYFCGQTLIKVHPGMDALFNSILKLDRNGLLVLPEGYIPELADQLRGRFNRTLFGMEHRIRFLPAMSHLDFLNVTALADVALDTRPFGGGNTSWQSIAAGTPMVTWPGNYLRGRYTQALYSLMGTEDAIASSAEDYVEKAIRFGNDPGFAADFNTRVDIASNKIFSDRTHIDALYDFLVGRVMAGI